MSNPALSNIPAFSGKTLTADELRRIYDQPAAKQPQGVSTPAEEPRTAHQHASGKLMTYENTISKTVLLFGIVLAFGAVGWCIPLLAVPAAIVGLVLGLVNAFKKQPSVPLIIAYAVAQGLFLGGISGIFEAQWKGIVSQAIFGTLAVFAVTLLLFRSGKVRTSSKMNKIVLIAMSGYLVFSLVNFALVMFGAVDDPMGMRGVKIFGIPLGLLVGLLAVFLAAYSLVSDFELVQNGVQKRVSEKWAWAAAFGLMVTLIWLYVEILRILALLRGNN